MVSMSIRCLWSFVIFCVPLLTDLTTTIADTTESNMCSRKDNITENQLIFTCPDGIDLNATHCCGIRSAGYCCTRDEFGSQVILLQKMAVQREGNKFNPKAFFLWIVIMASMFGVYLCFYNCRNFWQKLREMDTGRDAITMDKIGE